MYTEEKVFKIFDIFPFCRHYYMKGQKREEKTMFTKMVKNYRNSKAEREITRHRVNMIFISYITA